MLTACAESYTAVILKMKNEYNAKACSRKETGRAGETIAAKYMESLGFRVAARNVHCSHREIDIICENDRYLVFAEVKTRTSGKSLSIYGRPGTAVNSAKRANLVSAANDYLRKNKTSKQPRLDVIEVVLSELPGGFVYADINHIRGAFTA